MESLFISLLVYIALGCAAGFLSGLLGAGGGLIIVPGLVWLFHLQSVNPSTIMHVAVGTSLATMIPVSFRSLLSHRKYDKAYFAIYKLMAPALIVGVIAGSILAHFIYSRELEVIFGIFVFFMAYMLLHDNKKSEEVVLLPGPFGMSAAGGFIGVQSGLLGLGGSAFSVPFLSQRGVNIRIAVTVSVAIALTASLLGTFVFMMTGLYAQGLPGDSIGYVNMPAWIGTTIGGVFIAPLGAKVSHLISPRKLKVTFAVFLVLVGVKMLW